MRIGDASDIRQEDRQDEMSFEATCWEYLDRDDGIGLKLFGRFF